MTCAEPLHRDRNESGAGSHASMNDAESSIGARADFALDPLSAPDRRDSTERDLRNSHDMDSQTVERAIKRCIDISTRLGALEDKFPPRRLSHRPVAWTTSTKCSDGPKAASEHAGGWPGGRFGRLSLPVSWQLLRTVGRGVSVFRSGRERWRGRGLDGSIEKDARWGEW